MARGGFSRESGPSNWIPDRAHKSKYRRITGTQAALQPADRFHATAPRVGPMITDYRSWRWALVARRGIVNRIWQHHFWEGLVRTVNDFGNSRRGPPSHPELLEWLTREFVTRRLATKNSPTRLIMTSSAISRIRPVRGGRGKARVDPEQPLALADAGHCALNLKFLRTRCSLFSGMLNSQKVRAGS